MRQVQVYIEGLKIELFEDEQINVTSSVQNINDISKVFTDFSQSFTVPASTVNNEIFKHFYQSDIGDPLDPTTLFDHNIRRNAVIEIDLTTFRRGKIQIEKANIKNGHAENYQITFYGEIRTLKDLFGVRYPLIASSRLWQYHHGTEDVTNNAHAIHYDELFPAIKISRLFQAIANDYGVTFTGTFLSDTRFNQVFLYGKNTTEYTWISEASNIDIDQITATVVDPSLPNPANYVDIYGSKINIEELSGVYAHIISFDILSQSVAGTWYIDIFQDGNYYQTVQGTTTGVFGNVTFINTSGLDTDVTFQLRADAIMDVDMNIIYQINGNNGVINYAQMSTVTTSLSGNVNINNVLPDIKVSDFFSGVLKEFNCTCVATDVNTFEILPLEDWYGQGAIVDITQYTDVDSIDIERIKLYKKIAFKYQQSESFANKNYFKTYNQQYGDLEYQYNYDGDEYTIEVPFENLLFQRSIDNSGNYAIFGYTLNENFQAYTPKPILLYLYGESDPLPHDIKFYTGATHLNIDTFALFGQDLTYQNTKYSLNFGADNSIIHLETIQQGT